MLLREVQGHVLRTQRLKLKRSLREIERRSVKRGAKVSLGYASEVERGIKEASSEMINLMLPLYYMTMEEFAIAVAKVIQEEEREARDKKSRMSYVHG
jgi:transcriptional regulator with XRE-family HTH domain